MRKKTFEFVQEKGDQTISVASWGCQLISRFSSLIKTAQDTPQLAGGIFTAHYVFFGSFDLFD